MTWVAFCFSQVCPSIMRCLLLQAQDYRVQYDAIVRIFVLPKSNNPHTLIVISLDPPIRKGQTHYPHILIQFHSEEERTIEMEITDEVFEAKNQAVRSGAHHPNSMLICFP